MKLFLSVSDAAYCAAALRDSARIRARIAQDHADSGEIDLAAALRIQCADMLALGDSLSHAIASVAAIPSAPRDPISPPVESSADRLARRLAGRN